MEISKVNGPSSPSPSHSLSPWEGKKKKKDKNLEQKVSQNQKSDFVLVAMDGPMYHLS